MCNIFNARCEEEVAEEEEEEEEEEEKEEKKVEAKKKEKEKVKQKVQQQNRHFNYFHRFHLCVEFLRKTAIFLFLESTTMIFQLIKQR